VEELVAVEKGWVAAAVVVVVVEGKRE